MADAAFFLLSFVPASVAASKNGLRGPGGVRLVAIKPAGKLQCLGLEKLMERECKETRRVAE